MFPRVSSMLFLHQNLIWCYWKCRFLGPLTDWLRVSGSGIYEYKCLIKFLYWNNCTTCTGPTHPLPSFPMVTSCKTTVHHHNQNMDIGTIKIQNVYSTSRTPHDYTPSLTTGNPFTFTSISVISSFQEYYINRFI